MRRSGKKVGRGIVLAVMWVFLGFGLFMEVMAEPVVSGLPGLTDSETPAQLTENPIRIGKVEGFTMDRVYIDGVDYVLSKHIEYYSSRGEPIRRAWIKQGARVKYALGPERTIEIMQLVRGEDDE